MASKKFHLELVTQMLTLCSSAFGLVAALAWNTVVQTFINDFIKPFLPAGGSLIISQLIYAAVITILVVTITLRLSQIKDSLESK
ncbi:hypothetical protein A2899_02415 [Candidatus Amesbacteria bacterium RIFCSPLOWO2_01_FULL_49_25]|uniref:Uncharacterized protein n=1 Tax=Candidatus Amesbacteria bacterium RIFCSPHIGHO2_01_FULL_48_32b TaxID=1797253 RepID=A0A1F4YER3_9BACT|nr:MAG: hypothetical protein A2876_04145 [Candidatus Amesbacteria bacterium RIFCSPHIGHO2_01_FULL_48_32b]OGD08590.1 MAG: hypothetical protein A2899_02415 [Candidatus Amesbacteria bacterium RIFCSPLOWO2_01_FULL_49_25]